MIGPPLTSGLSLMNTIASSNVVQCPAKSLRNEMMLESNAFIRRPVALAWRARRWDVPTWRMPRPTVQPIVRRPDGGEGALGRRWQLLRAALLARPGTV